jgi:hypothetical protein
MGRIAAHPQLFSDDVLRVFLTSGEKIDAKISVVRHCTRNLLEHHRIITHAKWAHHGQTPKKELGDGEPGSEELKSKDVGLSSSNMDSLFLLKQCPHSPLAVGALHPPVIECC